MNLGVNPLLQFGLEETRRTLCENILADLSVISYVPFDSSTIGNPALDLGDVLTFSGGQTDGTQTACITSIEHRIGGRQSIRCVGKNPRLAQAKSKNDKNISGLLNQIEAGKIGIHTFTNASAYTIADSDVRIISIEFASSEETHVQFFGQVLVDVSAVQTDREASAKGSIVIPSASAGTGEDASDSAETDTEDGTSGSAETDAGTVTVEVELPVTWKEDGMAEAVVTFVFNDDEILLHHRQRLGTAGSISSPCIIRLIMSCRILRILLRCICGWRMERGAWIPGAASLQSAVRQWRRQRHGTAKSI